MAAGVLRRDASSRPCVFLFFVVLLSLSLLTIHIHFCTLLLSNFTFTFTCSYFWKFSKENVNKKSLRKPLKISKLSQDVRKQNPIFLMQSILRLAMALWDLQTYSSYLQNSRVTTITLQIYYRDLWDLQNYSFYSNFTGMLQVCYKHLWDLQTYGFLQVSWESLLMSRYKNATRIHSIS